MEQLYHQVIEQQAQCRKLMTKPIIEMITELASDIIRMRSGHGYKDAIIFSATLGNPINSSSQLHTDFLFDHNIRSELASFFHPFELHTIETSDGISHYRVSWE